MMCLIQKAEDQLHSDIIILCKKKVFTLFNRQKQVFHIKGFLKLQMLQQH